MDAKDNKFECKYKAFGKVLEGILTRYKILYKDLGATIGVGRTMVSHFTAGRYLPDEEQFNHILTVLSCHNVVDADSEALINEWSKKRVGDKVHQEITHVNLIETTPGCLSDGRLVTKDLSEENLLIFWRGLTLPQQRKFNDLMRQADHNAIDLMLVEFDKALRIGEDKAPYKADK